MMDNFSQILWQLAKGNAYPSNSHFGGATPFKVQVSFEIPIFEGQKDANIVDRWLNMLGRIFFSSRLFQKGKYFFCTPQSNPTCQRLVGNLM